MKIGNHEIKMYSIRRYLLLTTAIILVGGLASATAYSILTATTGGINISTRPLASNIQVRGGMLQYTDINGNNLQEQCAATNNSQAVDCSFHNSPTGPVSNPTITVYVNDTFTLTVQFVNVGTESGNLTSINFWTAGAGTFPGTNTDGIFTLTNPIPQVCTPPSGGCTTPSSFLIPIPVSGGPINLIWTIQVVGVGTGSDLMAFRFTTSG